MDNQPKLEIKTENETTVPVTGDQPLPIVNTNILNDAKKPRWAKKILLGFGILIIFYIVIMISANLLEHARHVKQYKQAVERCGTEPALLIYQSNWKTTKSLIITKSRSDYQEFATGKSATSTYGYFCSVQNAYLAEKTNLPKIPEGEIPQDKIIELAKHYLDLHTDRRGFLVSYLYHLTKLPEGFDLKETVVSDDFRENDKAQLPPYTLVYENTQTKALIIFSCRISTEEMTSNLLESNNKSAIFSGKDSYYKSITIYRDTFNPKSQNWQVDVNGVEGSVICTLASENIAFDEKSGLQLLKNIGQLEIDKLDKVRIEFVVEEPYIL